MSLVILDSIFVYWWAFLAAYMIIGVFVARRRVWYLRRRDGQTSKDHPNRRFDGTDYGGAGLCVGVVWPLLVFGLVLVVMAQASARIVDPGPEDSKLEITKIEKVDKYQRRLK